MPVLGTESLHAIKDYIDSGAITKITYNDLVLLRDQNKLRPGTRYQITDYSTTTVQRNTRSAGHLFDVIVLATSENDLSEDAWVTYHTNSDGSPDGYFAEMTIGSASWISPMPTPEEINVLYRMGTTYTSPETAHDTARVITELSMLENQQGITVPAMFNPAPDDDETMNLWYVYAGVFSWRKWTNNAITVSYIIDDDSDEELYTGTAKIRDDLFCDISVNNGIPVLYKTDLDDYDPTTEVDYGDEYRYVGDFEFDGTLYNKWWKYEQGDATHFYLLTNIIVVNNQFIMTPEEFRNNVQEEEAVYDMWQEYSPYTGWGNFYQLTDHLVDAELTKLFKKVKLDAWQIKYCLDNDTTRFTWADEENGKGVIYYMKDEWNNECSYDFKNIQFKRYRVTMESGTAKYIGFDGKYVGCKDAVPMGYTIPDEEDFLWVYTFNVEDNSSIMHDSSVEQELIHNEEGGYSKTVYNNLTKAGLSSEDDESNHNHIIQLPNVVFNTMWSDIEASTGFAGPFSNVFGNSCVNITLCANCNNNTFGNDCQIITIGNSCYNNVFGYRCIHTIMGNSCYSNIFGDSCYGNTLGDDCYHNTLGHSCDNNIFATGCYNNKLGDNCNINIFNNGCYNNIFGNSCYNNTFGDTCSTNTFGNNCNYNTFGYMCYINTFGNECASNTFGERFHYNTFGNDCYSNQFDTFCYSNHFGNQCTGNTFGSSCGDNLFGNYCMQNIVNTNCRAITFGNQCTDISINIYGAWYIIVDNGCQYLNITTSDDDTTHGYLQNVHVHLGVSGTSDNIKTLTVATRNNTFETNFKPANSVDIEV